VLRRLGIWRQPVMIPRKKGVCSPLGFILPIYACWLISSIFGTGLGGRCRLLALAVKSLACLLSVDSPHEARPSHAAPGPPTPSTLPSLPCTIHRLTYSIAQCSVAWFVAPRLHCVRRGTLTRQRSHSLPRRRRLPLATRTWKCGARIRRRSIDLARCTRKRRESRKR